MGSTGAVSVVTSDAKRSNGEAFGPDGRRYVVVGEGERVVAFASDGTSTTIATEIVGNDLVVRHDGGVYVTNPSRDPAVPGKVWYVSPKGEKSVVDTGLKFPNGVTVSPDQSLLYVAEARSHWVYSYQIQPDGSLADKQKYYHLHVPDDADDSGADGIRVDRDGRLYVATRMGLQVCDQAGRVNCIIPTPNGKVSNLTFGGPDFNVLYATCGEKVYKRQREGEGRERV